MSTPLLPDDVAEVASINIVVGMGAEEGTGCSFSYDGLSAEAAIGYLTTIADQLRDEVREKWAMSRGDTDLDFLESIHVECPNCGTDVNLLGEDEDEDGDV